MTNKKKGMVKVTLNRAGIIACGDYVAGIVYEVTENEARRLVEVKGFTLINSEDED